MIVLLDIALIKAPISNPKVTPKTYTSAPKTELL